MQTSQINTLKGLLSAVVPWMRESEKIYDFKYESNSTFSPASLSITIRSHKKVITLVKKTTTNVKCGSIKAVSLVKKKRHNTCDWKSLNLLKILIIAKCSKFTKNAYLDNHPRKKNVQPHCNGHFCWRCELASHTAEV